MKIESGKLLSGIVMLSKAKHLSKVMHENSLRS